MIGTRYFDGDIIKFSSHFMVQCFFIQVWNVDQMGLQLEIPPGRKIMIGGTKKIIRPVQHIDATIHSFTIHIQMKASGILARKLPVILYEPVGLDERRFFSMSLKMIAFESLIHGQVIIK